MSSNPRRFYKIVIVGDSGCGKTALANRFVKGTFTNDYQASIGVSLFTKTVETEWESVELQIWDTVGQERFQSLGSSFYRGANACVLVFDMTRRSSFENLNMWKGEFLLQANTIFRDSCPFVIIGTKCDRVDIEVTQEDVFRWCEQQGFPNSSFIQTSAKTNENIEEAFKYVTQTAIQYSFRQTLYNPGIIDITDNDNLDRFCKC